MEKTVKTSGADERTPSRSEYFSWINNTNEGSTQEQTLANIAFFRYLKNKYGMTLDIYAWDAGNMDGSEGTYERIDGEKITKQYPDGYGKVVAAAAEMGTRMGVWGGADGYGDTAEQAEQRRKMIVDLCKDYNWALFKFDAVCGPLRADKRAEFAKTMQECRKYSPDLILLNHRNDLGEAEIYATTFLWEGLETYIDVHGVNRVTAPHNRAFMFFRGHTPDNKRLTEDHGVCISSSIDFFEDELVYQAFNRSLILAPEIYGNPWLMRDDEMAKLARIFNLHRRHRDILVDALTLDEQAYGNGAIARGDGKRRFIATGNASWADRTIEVKLDQSIGLSPCKKVRVCTHFPYEQLVGDYDYGSVAKVNLRSWRATLIEVVDLSVADEMPEGIVYEVLHETSGKADKINVLANRSGADKFDLTLASPRKLGSLSSVSVPSDAEKLYETQCFGADNDSLEYRSLLRSGVTSLPQVQACRDYFFRQPSYVCRGIQCDIPFDGNADAVFDTKSRAYSGGHRIKGGCLRIDFGAEIDAERLEIEFFDGLQNPPHVFFPQEVADNAEISDDLLHWHRAPLAEVATLGNYDLRYFDYYVDRDSVNHGIRKKAVIALPTKCRYFRMAEPVDRIFTVKAFKGATEVPFVKPHLTNLFAPYSASKTSAVSSAKFVVDKSVLPLHPYIAVAVEGETGLEGASVVARVDGKLLHFPSRAPAYPANPYEWRVAAATGRFTYFLPLTDDLVGKEIEIIASFVDNAVPVDVYLCDANAARIGVIKKV